MEARARMSELEELRTENAVLKRKQAELMAENAAQAAEIAKLKQRQCQDRLSDLNEAWKKTKPTKGMPQNIEPKEEPQGSPQYTGNPPPAGSPVSEAKPESEGKSLSRESTPPGSEVHMPKSKQVPKIEAEQIAEDRPPATLEISSSETPQEGDPLQVLGWLDTISMGSVLEEEVRACP